MKKIWKFTIPVEKTFTLIMPAGAEILSVRLQGEEAVMWVMVNPGAGDEYRHFEMFGTGEEINLRWEDGEAVSRRYIGTVQPLGVLAFHIFEYAEQKD